jgi:Cu/Ag efflux pump CusA
VLSLTAIPLSLIAATLVLTAMGATLNTMVIAGLVIGMGEVVDDAIIDLENIVRRLRLNRTLARPRSCLHWHGGRAGPSLFSSSLSPALAGPFLVSVKSFSPIFRKMTS